MSEKDKTRGLYGKYRVWRSDGASKKGKKHHGCRYFVLDLTHDRHAKAAILAYAQSCAEEFPLLAADLRRAAGCLPTFALPTPPGLNGDDHTRRTVPPGEGQKVNNAGGPAI